MFDDNKVNQEGLVAGRDIAGRDINNTYNLHAAPIFHEDSTLKALLIEHEKEKKNDPAYRKFSDELNKFFSKSLRKNPRNLEEKLRDGGRDYLIESAMESKEKVTKKIKKYSYFKSAQEIYTYLLTNIRTAFLHEVQSKIKSDDFLLHQIDDIVSNKIIGPFLHNLNGSSLGIDKNELYGLLYFLTGNCYIEWD